MLARALTDKSFHLNWMRLDPRMDPLRGVDRRIRVELLAESVLATEYPASSEDLQRTIHAYPTLADSDAARLGTRYSDLGG
jgi:hypothetical protein